MGGHLAPLGRLNPHVSVKFSRLDLEGAGTGEDDARGHNEADSAWENDPMWRPGTVLRAFVPLISAFQIPPGRTTRCGAQGQCAGARTHRGGVIAFNGASWFRLPVARDAGCGPRLCSRREHPSSGAYAGPAITSRTSARRYEVRSLNLIWRNVCQVGSVDCSAVVAAGGWWKGCSGGEAPGEVLDVGQSHMRGLATPGPWFRRWRTRV